MPICEAPVALFIFNRPDLTAKTFERIGQARPRQLLVIADGPRADRSTDSGLCAATRALIVADWPCEVKTHYSDANLGCGRRMATGISWVFEQVDRAILLEDDCLPDSSFFPYCSEMLNRHADDDAVMSVSGFAARPLPRLAESYYFSRVGSIWGWATWRRAWKHYDYTMAAWATSLSSPCWEYFGAYKQVMQKALENGLPGRVNTWDYQWHFTLFRNCGLSIIPKTNLIENTGMRHDATHTTSDSSRPTPPVIGLKLPLRHPPRVAASRSRDLKLIEVLWEIRRASVVSRIRQTLKKILKRC